MQPSVSFTPIVRSQVAKLPGCLQCIAGIPDEIIVVDTGSTDRTKHVAAGFGAKAQHRSFAQKYCANEFPDRRKACLRRLK